MVLDDLTLAEQITDGNNDAIELLANHIGTRLLWLYAPTFLRLTEDDIRSLLYDAILTASRAYNGTTKLTTFVLFIAKRRIIDLIAKSNQKKQIRFADVEMETRHEYHALGCPADRGLEQQELLELFLREFKEFLSHQETLILDSMREYGLDYTLRGHNGTGLLEVIVKRTGLSRKSVDNALTRVREKAQIFLGCGDNQERLSELLAGFN